LRKNRCTALRIRRTTRATSSSVSSASEWTSPAVRRDCTRTASVAPWVDAATAAKVAGVWSLVCLALNLRRMATKGVQL